MSTNNLHLRRTEDEPHDRLTRICAAMTDAMDACPETQQGDKAIVFLDDGRHGGIQLHGYNNDVDAMADLLMHLTALFKANGKELQIIPIETMGQG
jgi:hypothetical protein